MHTSALRPRDTCLHTSIGRYIELQCTQNQRSIITHTHWRHIDLHTHTEPYECTHMRHRNTQKAGDTWIHTQTNTNIHAHEQNGGPMHMHISTQPETHMYMRIHTHTQPETCTCAHTHTKPETHAHRNKNTHNQEHRERQVHTETHAGTRPHLERNTGPRDSMFAEAPLPPVSLYLHSRYRCFEGPPELRVPVHLSPLHSLSSALYTPSLGSKDLLCPLSGEVQGTG